MARLKPVVFPGANDVREHSAGAMIERMPQPPCPRFGPDKTPHFIQLGGARWPDADGADA
jgi:hypothetical protein